MDLERLKKLLHYDCITGVFRWRVSRGRARVGAVAGKVCPDGYVRVGIYGRSYAASNLAWLYMTGSWPKHEVDHRDLSRSNDAWKNLRPATRAQNEHNQGAQKNNKLGLKGVRRFRTKYRAQIGHEGKTIHLGTFDTPGEAHEAYCLAASRLHGEFARTA